MASDKSTGKLISLFEMLTDNNDAIHKVLIPKIQRDYAQGRDSATAIRTRFLARLFRTIDEDAGEPVMLDFVFGQKEERTSNIFYPVDGQQRLTTLFLLHLYIGKRAGTDTDFLRKFSYETRTSSKQFCERLHDIPGECFAGIRSYIRSQWWYTGLWRYDPTISSMINMLDDIDRHYGRFEISELQGVWDRLKTNIKFWRLYLSDLETTDELYIKMNSRGKLLTDFEHFKAMLDEYAGTKGRLSAKIDTVWTNLLWRYRDAAKDFAAKDYAHNGLDRCFTNLLVFYLNIEGCKRGLINYQYPQKDILQLADTVLDFHPDNGKEYTDEELANLRNAKKRETETLMGRFETILDFFCMKNTSGDYVNDPRTFFGKFVKTVRDEWHVDNGCEIKTEGEVKVFIENLPDIDLLKAVCNTGLLKNEPTLYMEAFFEYATLGGTLSPGTFLERLRVLRNLVENTEVHADVFTNTLRLVDHIISTGETTRPAMKDEINNRQKEQEAFKLTWMSSHPEYSELLKTVENHWLVMGNANIFIKEETEGKDIDIVSLERFGRLFHSSADYYEIEKALLTCGDYSPTPSRGGVKGYGGANRGLWKNLTQSFNPVTPVVVRKFLNLYDNYSTEELQRIKSEFVNDTTRTRFPWTYYLCKYSVIRNAPKAKYRYLGGMYSYLKLNANGGGGPEYYWNPYNLAVEHLIIPEIDCTTDCGGKALHLLAKNISVDIKEREIQISYPDGSGFAQPIPQEKETGIDTVDRVIYTTGVCQRVFNTYNPKQVQNTEVEASENNEYTEA